MKVTAVVNVPGHTITLTLNYDGNWHKVVYYLDEQGNISEDYREDMDIISKFDYLGHITIGLEYRKYRNEIPPDLKVIYELPSGEITYEEFTYGA